MSISAARQYPMGFQQQVINEVKVHQRLLSDVAKQYGVSSKTVYKWVKYSDDCNSEIRGEIISEIAYLKQKITKLSQQLQIMAS